MAQNVNGDDEPLASFTQFVSELMRKDISEWEQSLEPWSILVDHGFDETPGGQLMLQIAMVATASRAKPDAGSWGENGFVATKGLVSRLFFARHKSGDTNWWRTALKPDVDRIIKRLSSDDWSRLWSMVSLTSRAARENRPTIPEAWFSSSGSLSPRMALILIDRVREQEAVRRLLSNSFIDCAGDETQISALRGQGDGDGR